ncbi:hypothetical protein ACFFJB_14260 [Camelimonas abortus]|uniref:Sulfur globule protein n=1 Tax=Camelimonas abortus TaxID=1017184 RepID=A0ABV7LAQ5_9HYPH
MFSNMIRAASAGAARFSPLRALALAAGLTVAAAGALALAPATAEAKPGHGHGHGYHHHHGHRHWGHHGHRFRGHYRPHYVRYWHGPRCVWRKQLTPWGEVVWRCWRRY